jgi:hypothetical protein
VDSPAPRKSNQGQQSVNTTVRAGDLSVMHDTACITRVLEMLLTRMLVSHAGSVPNMSSGPRLAEASL